MAHSFCKQTGNGQSDMRRAALVVSGLIAGMLLAYALTARPTECSVAANLIGRTDALFACLMQR